MSSRRVKGRGGADVFQSDDTATRGLLLPRYQVVDGQDEAEMMYRMGLTGRVQSFHCHFRFLSRQNH